MPFSFLVGVGAQRDAVRRLLTCPSSPVPGPRSPVPGPRRILFAHSAFVTADAPDNALVIEACQHSNQLAQGTRLAAPGSARLVTDRLNTIA
ncbi:hypothetical protein [Streptomyces sp. NPDC002215]|uniref:hypothetical protein n=1 Tax=Streptomyces sp. NPDC002215 TaxID=3154412 RepID=UPI00331EDD90